MRNARYIQNLRTIKYHSLSFHYWTIINWISEGLWEPSTTLIVFLLNCASVLLYFHFSLFLILYFHFAFKWVCFVTRKFLKNNEDLEFYHELVLLMSFVKHRRRPNKIIFFKHCYSLLLRENKLLLCFTWFDLFMLLTFDVNLLDLNSKVFLYVWHLKQNLLSRAPIRLCSSFS